MPHPDDPWAGADLVIKSLVDHYLHTDRLIWLRVQYLILIDAAVWSGMYVLWQSHKIAEAFFVGVAGIVFTYMLLVIVRGAIDNRDFNMSLVDKLMDGYLGPSALSCVKEHARSAGAPERRLMFAVPEVGKVYRRNGALRFQAVWLFRLAFWISIAIDLAFLAIIIQNIVR